VLVSSCLFFDDDAKSCSCMSESSGVITLPESKKEDPDSEEAPADDGSADKEDPASE